MTQEFSSMTSKYVKLVASVLILLVMTLPFTFALEVSNAYAMGTIGSGNVVKPNDEVTITANVTKGEDEPTIAPDVLKARMKIGNLPNSFSGCLGSAENSNLLTCTGKFTLNTGITSTVSSAIAALYESSLATAPLISSKPATFYVDASPPVPVITRAVQDGLGVVADFRITDNAIASNPNICSGLSNVNLFWRVANQVVSIPFTLDAIDVGSCSFTNQSIIDVAGLPSGQRSLCLNATDRAGNNGYSSCVSVNVDMRRPAISNISLATQYARTTYISSSGTSVAVVFNVTNVKTDTIVVKVDDVDKGPVTCDARGFCRTAPFDISETKAYAISITAKSAAGLSGTETVSPNVQVDATAPVFTSLKSNIAETSKIYFTSGRSLIASFTESGIGMTSAKAVLKIGTTVIGPPNNCSLTAGRWDCTWSNINYASTTQGNVTAEIIDVFDDLGNRMTASANATLFVDTQAPFVNLATLNVTSTGPRQMPGVFFSGSTIQIRFNATDASSFKVVGNYSAFKPQRNITEKQCGNGVCVLDPNMIGKGPEYGSISLMVIDALGNNYTFNTPNYQQLETLSTGSIANFSHSLKLSPSSLEQTTFAYTNPHAYALIDIRGVGGVVPLSVAMLDGKCRNIPTVIYFDNGTERSRSSTVGDARLLKTGSPSVSFKNDTQILLSLEFRPTDTIVNQSNIAFLCDLVVSGRKDNVYIASETETVLINFTMYNMSVGEIGSNYQKKVDDQIKKAKSHIGGKLAQFEKLFDMASRLCRLWRVISLALGILGIAGVTLKTASKGPTATGFFAWLGKSMDLTGGAACVGADVADTTIDQTMTGGAIGKVCDFVNCKWPTPETLGVKIPGGAAGNSVYASINPDQSLAAAIARLCIPAIIRNLRRAQQIECSYALCLKNDVPKGIPIEACDSAYQYSSCVYKTSNFFFLGGIWDAFINKIKSMFSDPAALAGTVLSLAACTPACLKPAEAGGGEMSTACRTVKFVAKTGALIKMITGIADDWKRNDYEAQDYCKQLDETQ